MGDVRNWPRNGAGQIVIDPLAEQDDEASGLQRIYEEARSAIAGTNESQATPPEEATARSSALTIRLDDRRVWAGVLAGLLVAVALIALISRAGAAPTPPLATPAPAASALPVATPFGAPLDVALVGYFDPHDLSSATALDSGTRIDSVARLGHEWLQLRVHNTAGPLVWVRWDALPAPSAAILDTLPDLAPAPTDAPPAPTSAPAAPVYVPTEIDVLAPSYQATDQALLQQMHPATPTPDVVATARAAVAAQIAGTHVAVCATAAALGAPGGVNGACGAP